MEAAQDHYTETCPDALWSYIIDLARTGVEGLRDKPSAAETDESQTYDHADSFGDYRQLPRQSEAIHSQPPEDFTAASKRRIGQEITDFAEANEDECGSPPTSPGQHQRYSGHHHHVFEPVAGQYVAARLLQSHNLIAPLAGVLENPRKLH